MQLPECKPLPLSVELVALVRAVFGEGNLVLDAAENAKRISTHSTNFARLVYNILEREFFNQFAIYFTRNQRKL